jgi:hypothetical protein
MPLPENGEVLVVQIRGAADSRGVTGIEALGFLLEVPSQAASFAGPGRAKLPVLPGAQGY